MGLGAALATAMSGLRANQAALSITSGNVANAQTPGYVTETPNQIEVATGSTGASVQVTGVNRQLDLYVQSQLRTETSGGAYADQMANILGQLQSVYGPPGRRWHARNLLQQLHHGVASAVDQPGQPVGAERSTRGRAIADAGAQHGHAGHPDAAHQCPAGYRFVGDPGQRRYDPDRAPSTASCRDWRRPIPRPLP